MLLSVGGGLEGNADHLKPALVSKWIIFNLQLSYLWVLVCRHSYELSLFKHVCAGAVLAALVSGEL